MTWDSGAPYLEELARTGGAIYAFVQPDGGWMVNNCGVVADAAGDAVLVDTTSTENRNRAVLAEVAKGSIGAPRAVVNTHHHPDHTYGNWFLPPETDVIGHDQCREMVLQAPASRRPRSSPRPTMATSPCGRRRSPSPTG